MPSKKKSATNDRTALYEALIATIPAIERKGDNNPYTSLNGNMFTLLHQSEAGHPPPGNRAREVPEEISDEAL